MEGIRFCCKLEIVKIVYTTTYRQELSHPIRHVVPSMNIEQSAGDQINCQRNTVTVVLRRYIRGLEGGLLGVRQLG